jgi:hypothetical protein
MSFIQKIDNIHLNVAVASKSKDAKHALTFLNNAEEILNVGAYFYHLFKERLAGFYHLALPTIGEIILDDTAYNKLYVISKNWRDQGLFSLDYIKAGCEIFFKI